MTGDLIMTAALVVAAFWIVVLELTIRRTRQSFDEVVDAANKAFEAGLAENQFLKGVLMDVAKGEANVWIEDGELRAARKTTGEVPIH